MKYAWIAGQREAYSLPAMCKTLGVSSSGYRAWQRGGRTNGKRLSNAQLLALICALHAELKGPYGSPRMVKEIRGWSFPASKEQVERLMRENGIRARHQQRYKATTDSMHALPVAPNVLDRDFAPTATNQVRTTDLTYIWTDAGWLYLPIVLDLFDREVAGWSIKLRMTADIVVDALTMAWFRRKPALGADPSLRLREPAGVFEGKLAEFGMTWSMRRKGNCWDAPTESNASTESFFNSLKNERVHGTHYETRDAARADVFEYIEVFYNRFRRHSSLDGVSPMRLYETWLQQQSVRQTA